VVPESIENFVNLYLTCQDGDGNEAVLGVKLYELVQVSNDIELSSSFPHDDELEFMTNTTHSRTLKINYRQDQVPLFT
jgi:hypothetical protein